MLGHYSPEEQYERSVLYGTSFQSWSSPIDTFAKPYGRGLRAVTDPIQGAMSWGTGGAILAGLPGAVAGGIMGGAYGTVHGMYRAISGTKYIPESFKEKVEMFEFFDNVEYQRNVRLYEATGDQHYKKEAIKTMPGVFKYNEGIDTQGMFATLESKRLRGSNAWNEAGRRANNPSAMGVGSDRGFGSPWQGINPEIAKEYDLSFHSVLGALPTWDRPFFSAFAMTPEDEQDRVLETVDRQLGETLRKVWRRPESENLPDPDTFFQTYTEPNVLNPIMDPTQRGEDIQVVTMKEEGLDAHDFGMGWREQMRRINSSASPIIPIDLNAGIGQMPAPTDISSIDLEEALRAILERDGYAGANIIVQELKGSAPSSELTINIKRSSSHDIIKTNYSNILHG